MSGRQQRVMVQPIVRKILLFHDTSQFLFLPSWQNVIFKNLQQVHPHRWRYHVVRYVLTLDPPEDEGRNLALRQY
jgi:hypothetical protein